MKNLNNLFKLLNKHNSKYYPYFDKGNLCVSDTEPVDARFVILRKKNGYYVYNIWNECYEAGEMGFMSLMRRGKALTEKQVVEYLDYLYDETFTL